MLMLTGLNRFILITKRRGIILLLSKMSVDPLYSVHGVWKFENPHCGAKNQSCRKYMVWPIKTGARRAKIQWKKRLHICISKDRNNHYTQTNWVQHEFLQQRYSIILWMRMSWFDKTANITRLGHILLHKMLISSWLSLWKHSFVSWSWLKPIWLRGWLNTSD